MFRRMCSSAAARLASSACQSLFRLGDQRRPLLGMIEVFQYVLDPPSAIQPLMPGLGHSGLCLAGPCRSTGQGPHPICDSWPPQHEPLPITPDRPCFDLPWVPPRVPSTHLINIVAPRPPSRQVIRRRIRNKRGLESRHCQSSAFGIERQET